MSKFLCTICGNPVSEIVERHNNFPVCSSCAAIDTMVRVSEKKQRIVVCLNGDTIETIHASRPDDDLEVFVLDFCTRGMGEEDIQQQCEALGRSRGFFIQHSPTEIPLELNADIDRILAAREREAEINRMTDEEQAALESLRSRGFAITVFAPGEINNASPRAVEESMVERGWQTISMEGK